MRGVFKTITAGAALAALLVAFAAPIAYAEDGNPYETPEARVRIPTGVTSQAISRPPTAVTSQRSARPAVRISAEARIRPPGGGLARPADLRRIDWFVDWLQARVGSVTD
jgi:hypothetical protein